MARRQVRVIAAGLVQGVWFRAWTEREATARGLDGWVRNRRDGTVEAVFAGEAAQVEDMLAACRRGPPMAEVSHLDVADWPEPVAPGFGQRPSA